MKKLYYDFHQLHFLKDHYKIEDIVVPVVPNTPTWWNKLSPYLNGTKSILDAWHTLTTDQRMNWEVYSTVKMCPGFHNLFRNSFLVKFPCDILVEHDDYDWTWRIPSKENPMRMNEHGGFQYGNSGPLQDYRIFKFEIPIEFTSKDKIDIMFFDPIYWKPQPYRVAPGVVSMENFNQSLTLNMIVFFPKTGKSESFHFRKGDPICLMNTNERVKLEQHKDVKPFHRKRFASSFKWDGKENNES